MRIVYKEKKKTIKNGELLINAWKPESPAENLCHPVDGAEQTHQD